LFDDSACERLHKVNLRRSKLALVLGHSCCAPCLLRVRRGEQLTAQGMPWEGGWNDCSFDQLILKLKSTTEKKTIFSTKPENVRECRLFLLFVPNHSTFNHPLPPCNTNYCCALVTSLHIFREEGRKANRKASQRKRQTISTIKSSKDGVQKKIKT